MRHGDVCECCCRECYRSGAEQGPVLPDELSQLRPLRLRGARRCFDLVVALARGHRRRRYGCGSAAARRRRRPDADQRRRLRQHACGDEENSHRYASYCCTPQAVHCVLGTLPHGYVFNHSCSVCQRLVRVCTASRRSITCNSHACTHTTSGSRASLVSYLPLGSRQ
jgi:hypothetical protein